jgi:hypothetical protein
MILFQNLAHNAIGTGGLSHAGANGHLVLVASWAAGGALEVDGTGTVLPALAQRGQLATRLGELGGGGFKKGLVLLVLVRF